MSDRKRSLNNNVAVMSENLNLVNPQNSNTSNSISQIQSIPSLQINNKVNKPNSINNTNSTSNSKPIEDSPDDVNYIIRHLGTPSDNVPTNVSKQYNNDSIIGNEIQAYAKIAGCNWTYYVKSLSISIGRNTEIHSNDPSKNKNSKEIIDIDLGPSKVVSRKHATIEYNLNGRKWQLFVLGRNGLKVNGSRLNIPNNSPYDLTSGNIIDIGGTQMMFVLPDASPIIPDHFRYLLSNKRTKLNNHLSNNKHSTDYNSKPDSINTQVKAFQLQEGISSLHPNSVSSEQDYSKDDAKDLKPPYSYATMITQAILSNPQGILSLAEIYDWISSHFAYYRHTKQGWQNSIRHNLSLNKAFEKVPRKPNEPGKGMKWQISESYRNEFLKKWQDGSLNKIRRGTSVSRQLQLHLIKNNALPKGRASPTFVDETKRHSVQLPNPINLSNLSSDLNPNPNPNSNSNPNPNPNSNPNLNPNSFAQQEKSNSQQFMLSNISPNKHIKNDVNFISTKRGLNSNLPSPVKTMSIPDINYLNSEQKISSGLISGLNNTHNSDQLLHSTSTTDNINSKLDNKNSISTNPNNHSNNNQLTSINSSKYNDDNLVRSQYTIPIAKIQVDENQLNSLTSPKKIFNRLDLMTPERNLQRPNLEQNSVHSQGNSVNSSPALWNYVQFSTPLAPSNGGGNAGNIINGDHDKLPKLELESPLKSRRNTGKVSDLKDVDLVKGFKQ